MGIRALIVCIILCRPVGTKSKRGKAPYQTGISIGEKRERYRVQLICPARANILQRAGQYLAAGVRISCGGRQKTTINRTTSAWGSNDR